MSANAKTPAWQQPGFAWQKAVAPYTQPSRRASWLQVANSLIPYLLLWGAMICAYDVSWVLLLGVL